MGDCPLIEALRAQLLAMRGEGIDRIVKRGLSSTLAVITELLATLDELPNDAEPANSATVSDKGHEIRLIFYSGEAGAAAAVELDPVAAIGIAAELIAAALPKLNSLLEDASGGDGLDGDVSQRAPERTMPWAPSEALCGALSIA
jgi:hypothetical protein